MASIIKSTSVRRAEPGEPLSAPARSPATRPGGGSGRCRKEVELLREDGVVHAIQLRCSCGEVTVVELSYPEPPEASA